MNFWLLIVITCVSMVFKDFVGVFMVIAESRGNAKLSAVLNPLGTVAGIAFYSFGAVELIQRYHWKGVIGLIPVLFIDMLDGYFFTKWGRSIESDEKPEEETEDRLSLKNQKDKGAGFLNW
jgi:hypothetical protein